ncbi:MAG: lysylphosphatidylglycerol synthase transmembrane domain-containing protein [Pseudomonadota bacterium]
MKTRDILRVALGLGVAAVFIWLTLRQVSLGEIGAAFAGTNLAFVGLGLLALAAGYSARIQRWRLMLADDNPNLRFSDCAGPFLSSFALNNVLPLRAGDMARLFAYRGRLGITLGTGAAAMFVERVLDMLALLVLLGVALNIFGGAASELLGLGGIALIAIALSLLAVLLIPALLSPAYKLGRSVLGLIPGGKGEGLIAEADKAYDTLHKLAAGGRMVRLAGLSAVAWLFEGLTFFAAALAIPAIAEAAGAWLALPVGSLSTLLPSTPGYAGTFHYFVTQAMQSLGANIGAATAYAVLIHAMLWLPITAAGGLAILFTAPWARTKQTKKPTGAEA